jgi:hypothetical protein
MKYRAYNGVEQADFWLPGIADRLYSPRQSKLAARIEVLYHVNFLLTMIANRNGTFL